MRTEAAASPPPLPFAMLLSLPPAPAPLSPPPEPVASAPRVMVTRPTAFWLLLAIFGLLVLLFLVFFGWAAALAEDGEFLQVLREAWASVLAEPEIRWALWALAVMLPLTGVVLWILSRAHLTIDATGISARIPRLPALPFLRQSGGHWQLSWNDIRRAELALPQSGGKHPQRLGFARLNLETDRGLFSLFVWRWFDPEDQDHRITFNELRRLRSLDFGDLLRRSPLVRALEAQGVPLEDAEGAPAPGASGEGGTLGGEHFDLNSHRGVQLQLGVLALAGGYALLDTFFLNPWKALEFPPVGPFVMAGLVGAVLVAPLGRGAPRIERIGVAALTVAALVAAVYPGLMRFNAATSEAQTIQYEALEPGVFHTPYADFPDLDLRSGGLEAYWARYTTGEQHDFRILEGAAGFYQINMARLHQRTRAFYRARRATN